MTLRRGSSFKNWIKPPAAAGILDDDEVHLPLRGESDNLLAHLQHGPMSAANLGHMENLILDANDGDRGAVIMGIGFSGGIAAEQATSGRRPQLKLCFGIIAEIAFPHSRGAFSSYFYLQVGVVGE